jgi:hypothetical protein
MGCGFAVPRTGARHFRNISAVMSSGRVLSFMPLLSVRETSDPAEVSFKGIQYHNE